MSIFLLMLTILLTKEVLVDGQTYCADLEIFQSSTNIPRNCTNIDGDLTIRDINNTSLLPLDNLKSIRTIIGKLEIARTSIRNLNFLSGVIKVTGSIDIHYNAELLYVERFFEMLSIIPDPPQFNFEQLQLRNNPKICLHFHFIASPDLRESLSKIKDEKTVKEVTETGCRYHCRQNLTVQEGCRYIKDNLILENIDELRRNELRKYMDIEVILGGSLIIRNNTGIKKLEFLSELREIYPGWGFNEKVAIEISDNVDMKMNFHEISIISFQNKSRNRKIKLDDEAQFKLITESFNENTTTTTTTTTTTEMSTVEIEVTTTLQEETTTLVVLVALKLPHLALAGVLSVIGLSLVLSAVLFWNYIIRIKRKIRKEMKSRSLFYQQTPTYSHRLEPDSSTSSYPSNS